MYDYMRELQQSFFKEPDFRTLRQEIDVLRRKAAQQLPPEGRQILLALMDNEATLREEIAFANFVAGFRLAGGLAMELSREKSFSFDDAEEYRVCTMLTKLQEK